MLGQIKMAFSVLLTCPNCDNNQLGVCSHVTVFARDNVWYKERLPCWRSIISPFSLSSMTSTRVSSSARSFNSTSPNNCNLILGGIVFLIKILNQLILESCHIGFRTIWNRGTRLAGRQVGRRAALDLDLATAALVPYYILFRIDFQIFRNTPLI